MKIYLLFKQGLALILLPTMFVITGCSSIEQPKSGVAKMNQSYLDGSNGGNPGRYVQLFSDTDIHKEDISKIFSDTKPERPTEEEIATIFALCMREKGLDVSDPVLLADGAVDWATLKRNIFEDPNFDENGSHTKSALDECSPILERVVMVDKQSDEDEIEFQDRSLDFAQCIRESGLNVPDPDFSGGSRSGIKIILTKIKSPDARVSKILDICKETAFGTGDTSS